MHLRLTCACNVRVTEDIVVCPSGARALMRGLAATDTGAEVLGVYDAIRAAGKAIGELSAYPAPPRPDVAAALAQARGVRPARTWKFEQVAYLQEAQDWAARIEGALQQEAALMTAELKRKKLGPFAERSLAGEGAVAQ